MLKLRPVYPDPDSVGHALAVFEKYPDIIVEYGNFTINTNRLILECKLIYEALKALDVAEKCTFEDGQRLIEIGNKYISEIGDENLVLEDVFRQNPVSGRTYSLILLATGFETLSDAVKWDDPKKAAEYQQQAMFYNRDRGDSEAIKKNENFIRGVSKTVHCWFCGKEVCGENIHFIPMPADLTKPVLSQVNADSPISTCDSKFIYTCRACYSSIDNNGYKHYSNACKYTDKQIDQLKVYTDQQIAKVDNEVEDLRTQINEIIRALKSLKS